MIINSFRIRIMIKCPWCGLIFSGSNFFVTPPLTLSNIIMLLMSLDTLYTLIRLFLWNYTTELTTFRWLEKETNISKGSVKGVGFSMFLYVKIQKKEQKLVFSHSHVYYFINWLCKLLHVQLLCLNHVNIFSNRFFLVVNW